MSEAGSAHRCSLVLAYCPEFSHAEHALKTKHFAHMGTHMELQIALASGHVVAFTVASDL